MADTRRVRFRVEWAEEVPADPEPGDRVAVPFRELVVREVASSWEDAKAAVEESQERGTPLRFPHLGHASSEDLDGADAIARLAPSLIEPGATWHASATVRMYGKDAEHERHAATLAEALDAFPAWAEEWVAHVRHIRDENIARAELTGHAELAVVEPQGPERGRTVLRVFFGNYERPLLGVETIAERTSRALEALCEEAERLYGRDERSEPK